MFMLNGSVEKEIGAARDHETRRAGDRKRSTVRDRGGPEQMELWEEDKQ
jgi:hypothetical protein